MRFRSSVTCVVLARIFCAVVMLSFPAFGEEFQGKVIRVLDGDTVEVLVQRQSKRIRLFGIDAPESRQAFGRRAREAAGGLAFGRTVKVVSHGMDQYGRILGEVVLPDGSILNERLVEQGWAWHYIRYSTSRRLAEKEMAARRGLWADPRPIPPWGFRKTRLGSRAVAR